MNMRERQSGIALLIFVTLLTGAVAIVSVSGLGDERPMREKITAAALAEAKDALIGYAITYGDTHAGQVHGYLPCPDQAGGNPEGSAEPTCGSQDVSQLGRLPWRTLDIGPLRGSDGECLWYAVSGNYKNNPKTGLLNWDTNGQIRIYDTDGTLLTPAGNQAVAVIFSPGMALPGQNRSGSSAAICGGNYTASNYLDASPGYNNATVSSIAGAVSDFRIGDQALTGDRLVFITKQDIWNALEKRRDFLATLDAMTRKTAECIAGFGTKNSIDGIIDPSNMSLPWPAPLSLADYSENANYDDSANLFSGRVPYRVNNSRTASGNVIAGDSLLTSGTCSAGICINNCPHPYDWANLYYPWWNNWKDHLFYGVSQEYKPANRSTPPCGNCLSVNHSGKYAAVVVFANRKLSGQIRASSPTDPARGTASNYLEGSNALSIANPSASGIENYQADNDSATFNDILYCIREDLTVIKGNPEATPACP